LAFVKGTIEVAIVIKDTLLKKKSPISLTEEGIKPVKDYNLKDI
jgi:hypothetical protein